MKNLELERFGLETLNEGEMKQYSGGMKWWVALGVFILSAGIAFLAQE